MNYSVTENEGGRLAAFRCLLSHLSKGLSTCLSIFDGLFTLLNGGRINFVKKILDFKLILISNSKSRGVKLLATAGPD